MEWESVWLDEQPKTFENNYLDSLVELGQGEGIYSILEKETSKYLVYIVKLPEQKVEQDNFIKATSQIFDTL